MKSIVKQFLRYRYHHPRRLFSTNVVADVKNGDENNNTFTLHRDMFGQSGTVNVILEHPGNDDDDDDTTTTTAINSISEDTTPTHNNNKQNEVLVNTTWTDVIDIQLSSSNNNFNFNNNNNNNNTDQPHVIFKETGSSDANSSQLDIHIHGFPEDDSFKLEINLPEHSNFSFLNTIEDLHTNIKVPRKLEGDVTLETSKGDIEINKLRGENIHVETEDGELSVSSVIEGSQFLMGNNVKAKRLMGKSVHVETCYDPYYMDNNTATSVPENPTKGNIDIDALYGGSYHLMGSYFGNINVGTVQGAMKIISYNNVNVRGVDGNIEVTTSGEVNVHFDHVGEHQISSIYCDPWNDLSTINVSVEDTAEADIIIANNSTFDIPLDRITVNEESKAADENDHDNKVETYLNYFEGTLLPSDDTLDGNSSGNQFESGKIRTLKDSGWDEEDIGNASNDETKEKKKPRARIFMIGGESTTFKIESWMDKIKKKYDMME